VRARAQQPAKDFCNKIGTKATKEPRRIISAYGGKADLMPVPSFSLQMTPTGLWRSKFAVLHNTA